MYVYVCRLVLLVVLVALVVLVLLEVLAIFVCPYEAVHGARSRLIQVDLKSGRKKQHS